MQLVQKPVVRVCLRTMGFDEVHRFFQAHVELSHDVHDHGSCRPRHAHRAVHEHFRLLFLTLVLADEIEDFLNFYLRLLGLARQDFCRFGHEIKLKLLLR